MEVGAASGPGEPELTAILDTEEAGGVAIRGSAFRLAGYGLSVILSVAGVAALTRYLGAADYGRYAVVQSLVALVAGIAEAGLVIVGVREYAVRSGADRAAMLTNLQGVRIAFGCAGVVVALAFAVVAGYDSTMVAGVALSGVALVITAVQATLGIPLSAGLRWTAVTMLDLLRQAGQVALILVFVAVGTGLLAFMAVPVPAAVIVLAATIPLVRGTVAIRPSFDWERWKGLLRLVAPYAAATAVSSVYVYVAAVLMEIVATQSEVGWFAASFRVFLVLAGIPQLLVGAVFPILARAARDDPRRHAYASERLLTTSLVAGAWLALMTALLAEPAIDVVAGADFGPSVAVLRIQAIAVFATFVVVATSHVLISLARYRDMLVLSSTALVISAATTLALAPSMGANGGGIANAVGEGVSAVLGTVFMLRAQRGVRMPWATTAKVVFVSAAAGTVALVPGLPPVADAIVATLVFGVLSLVLRAIPDELLDAVPFLRR